MVKRMVLPIRESNSILILFVIAFLSNPLCYTAEGKEYLSGAIVIDKLNNDKIEMMSLNFRDNPFSVITRCNLISKTITQSSYPDMARSVYQRENYSDEEIEISDGYSWFNAIIT